MKCIVFLGIQGSGKGTQAKLISDRLGYQHVNIGDLFREQIAMQSPLGEEVRHIIQRGELVSDDLVFSIIDSSVAPDISGIVFDGFPRTLVQAEFLIKHYEVLQVFFLDLSEEDAVNRISSRRVCVQCGANYNLIGQAPKVDGVCDVCGGELSIRQDDKPEAIKQRVHEFYQQTFNLQDFFAAKNLLTTFNANLSIEELAKQIARVLQFD